MAVATKTRVPLLVATALAAAAGPARPQGLRFTRFGTEDGLSQYAVNTVVQDVDGFLWVGTANGLNRYDGTSFRSSWERGGEPSPLSYGSVQTLYSDRRGRLWVGMDKVGLYLYDRRREAFDSVPVRDASGAPRSSPQSYFAFAEVGDTVLVGTDEGLGAISQGPTGRFLVLGRAPLAGCSASVTALLAVSDTLWLGTKDGCVIREVMGGHEGKLIRRMDSPVSRIAPGPGSPGGALYVTTDGSGVFILHRDGRLVRAGPRSRTPSPTDHVWSILTTESGDTWLGTLGGLGWLRHGGADTTWFEMGSTRAGALPHRTVKGLWQDRSGALWIGTWGGLARLTPLYQGIGFIPEGMDPHGEPVGGVVAITADGPGRLLTGSIGGRLAHVPATSTVPGTAEAGAPAMGDIFSLAWGPNHDLWVASYLTAIFHRTSTGWRAYRKGAGGPGTAPDEYPVSVFVDHAGSVWAGSRDLGLMRYDAGEDRFCQFRPSGPTYGLGRAYVWPIREDGRHNLWFGKDRVEGGGIYRLGPDRKTLDFFPTGGPLGERPNAGRVLTLLPVGDTVVWFGTQGGGLGRLDPRSGALRFYTTRDGLPHDNVEGILQDVSGKLWVSTNHGIARFDPATERFWVLQEALGIPGEQFRANSAYASPEGVLYFGGAEGISVIHPERVTPDVRAPPLALTRFLVRGVARSDVTNLSARDGIDLGPGENFFTFEFTGLNFADDRTIRFRYRLANLEEDWVDAGSDHSARYTGIGPGHYTFLVQARSSMGDWGTEGMSIPIVVHPTFYQTLWFKASLLASILGLVAAGMAYRRNELERVRLMRLDIAEDLHNDIGANLSAIALKSDLVKRVAREDIRGNSILGDIQGLTQDTMHKVREMIWVVREEHDTVGGLVTRMEDAAGTLLGGVVDYAFVVDQNLPDAPLAMSTRQDIYRIFKEALQNVMKHAGECRVDITVQHRPPELVVTVCDDGCGFEESRVEPGNGLKLMRARTRRQRIRVTVSSVPEQGTRVEIAARI